ncbi:hypothetical protein A6P39_005240 [Streptomyces sp. FXJ1.172]|uniref:hypothetical protein n=1 Tax=Streptomyces sp. FXJ1.172 TaxID=710705 RepID=UPI0007CF2122|nr:hypothetical protein [Streptomyces sp. FXJ1.172]WEO93469.1 hypothetical protein A6P39_005240 [Streptomyces sp. FXJ1.172]
MQQVLEPTVDVPAADVPAADVPAADEPIVDMPGGERYRCFLPGGAIGADAVADGRAEPAALQVAAPHATDGRARVTFDIWADVQAEPEGGRPASVIRRGAPSCAKVSALQFWYP